MTLLFILLALLFIFAMGFIFWPLCQEKKTRILAIFLLLFAALFSFFSYWHLGSWGLLQEKFNQQDEKRISAQITSLGGGEEIIRKLKTHLLEHPKEGKGWYLLGKIYFSQNQFQKASEAFKLAYDLNPQQIEVLVALAESQYLQVGKQNQQMALFYVQRALALDPRNIAALNLLALIQYKNKNYPKAISIWQDILLQVPKDSDTAHEIKAALEKATKQEAAKFIQ